MTKMSAAVRTNNFCSTYAKTVVFFLRIAPPISLSKDDHPQNDLYLWLDLNYSGLHALQQYTSSSK